MKSFMLLAVLFLLTSCATTMPGKNLDLNSKSLGVALSENPAFSNSEIKMFQISVKNLTNDWITIDSAIISNAPTSKVLVGEKISSWFEACTLEQKVSDYNTSLVLGALAVGGAVVAGTSNSKSTATTGAVVALGAISVASVKDYVDSKNKVEFQSAFPEGHALRSFVIPPQKVIQRWILIENKNKETPVMTLTSKDQGVGEVSLLLSM